MSNQKLTLSQASNRLVLKRDEQIKEYEDLFYNSLKKSKNGVKDRELLIDAQNGLKAHHCFSICGDIPSRDHIVQEVLPEYRTMTTLFVARQHKIDCGNGVSFVVTDVDNDVLVSINW